MFTVQGALTVVSGDSGYASPHFLFEINLRGVRPKWSFCDDTYWKLGGSRVHILNFTAD